MQNYKNLPLAYTNLPLAFMLVFSWLYAKWQNCRFSTEKHMIELGYGSLV